MKGSPTPQLPPVKPGRDLFTIYGLLDPGLVIRYVGYTGGPLGKRLQQHQGLSGTMLVRPTNKWSIVALDHADVLLDAQILECRWIQDLRRVGCPITNRPSSVPVRCLETAEVWASMTAAARDVGHKIEWVRTSVETGATIRGRTFVQVVA